MKTFKRILKSITAILLLGSSFLPLYADADPFYTKIFNEGKNYFTAGNFREAIVNFEIAEFGLLDESEVLKDIYLYYSLAQFRLGRINEAREIIKKFETELNIKDLDVIVAPQSIDNQVRAMLAALARLQGTNDGSSAGKIYSIESLLLETMQLLEADKFDLIENNIKKLETIDKKESRIDYIKGILKFKQKDYRGCVKSLKAFEQTLPPSSKPALMDDLFYYLGLSYHYLKNAGQAAFYYDKTRNLDVKTRLYQIISENKNDKNKKNEKEKNK